MKKAASSAPGMPTVAMVLNSRRINQELTAWENCGLAMSFEQPAISMTAASHKPTEFASISWYMANQGSGK